MKQLVQKLTSIYGPTGNEELVSQAISEEIKESYEGSIPNLHIKFKQNCIIHIQKTISLNTFRRWL